MSDAQSEIARQMDSSLCTCPHCGFVCDPDDYDVMGADDDKLFCPDCGIEVVPVEGTA